MNCPSCNTSNPDGSRFCLRCGNPIPAQSAPQPPTSGGPVRAMRPMNNQPQAGYQNPPHQPMRTPDEYPTPPIPPQRYAQASVPQQQYAQSAAQYPQQYPQQQYAPQRYTSPSSSQTSASILNIWGPFAGYGARRRHLGWLMDGQAERHANLLQSVNKRLRERQIPGVEVTWQTLTAKGFLVETRPYFLIRKNLVSLALNVGTFGTDLFISMATYLKPPISNFRAILAGLSTLLFIAGGPILGSMIGASISGINIMGNNSDVMSSLLTTLCCLGPIWSVNAIIFPLALIYSFYKWLTEKDFLSLLRVKPNEFNEDDLMALEKAVEQTVRSGLDDIGLNPADLKPAAVQGSEMRLI